MKRFAIASLLLVTLACGRSETPAASTSGAATPAPAAGSGVEQGRKLAAQSGCVTCHVIPGVEGSGGMMGPSLAGIGRRQMIVGKIPNTPDNLRRYIENPASLDPQTSMPALGISPETAGSIAEYLMTLK